MVWLPQGQRELRARLTPGVTLEVVLGDGKCLLHCFQHVFPEMDAEALMATAGWPVDAWGDEAHLARLADVFEVALASFSAGIQHELMKRVALGTRGRRLGKLCIGRETAPGSTLTGLCEHRRPSLPLRMSTRSHR